MSDSPHHQPPDPAHGTSRARTGIPGWVWIAFVLALAVAALGSAWWVEQDREAVLSEAPGQPAEFCNTVGELQAVELDVTVGEPTGGLQPAVDGLRRLAAAEPPQSVRDDLESLAAALEEVQAEAAAVPADDPDGLSRVVALLDGRLRDLQPASERVDAYTQRWCGASINETPTSEGSGGS